MRLKVTNIQRASPLHAQWVGFSTNQGVTHTGNKRVSRLGVLRGRSVAQSTGTRYALPGWVKRGCRRTQKRGVKWTDQIFQVRENRKSRRAEGRKERDKCPAFSSLGDHC